MISSLDRFFESRRDYGVIFLRLMIGWRLVDGTQDNVFSHERMMEFYHFLDQHGMPLPLLAAYVSVYAQFICGILYITGAWIRLAAIVMIANFAIALLLVHVGLTFEQSFDALMMFFGSVFFLFNGAGSLSVDRVLDRKSFAKT